MSLDTPYPLPPNLSTYPHQIGGHGALMEKKDTLLCDPFGNLFKPVQWMSEISHSRVSKGRREAEFYQFLSTSPIPEIIGLKPFVPNFRGVFRWQDETTTKVMPVTPGSYFSRVTGVKTLREQFSSESLEKENDFVTHKHRHIKEKDAYLGMSDALVGLRKPCIMDVKMGAVTYEPDASPAKIAVERAKYMHREALGFLITGIKLFDCNTESYKFFDWFHGNCLTPDTVYQRGIRLFFEPAFSTLPRALICRLVNDFIARLNELRLWFEKQTLFAFYATSLLLAYDAAPENLQQLSSKECVDYDGKQSKLSAIVRLIDFTHVIRSEQMDKNFLCGLDNLLGFFDKLRNELHDPALFMREPVLNEYFKFDVDLDKLNEEDENDDDFDAIVAANAAFASGQSTPYHQYKFPTTSTTDTNHK